MKKILLALGTLATVAAPVAAIVSCGSDNAFDQVTTEDKTNKTIFDAINGQQSPYENPYDYNELLKNNGSKWTGATGNADADTLNIDLGSLAQLADSYPITQNSWNANLWSDLVKENVADQLTRENDAKTTGQLNPDELAALIKEKQSKISETSKPLSIETDSIYYTFYNSFAPDAFGVNATAPGHFYHIRPSAAGDEVLKHDWEYADSNTKSNDVVEAFKEAIEAKDPTSGKSKWTDGDQIIFNFVGGHDPRKMTYYTTWTKGDDDDQHLLPEALQGFYVVQPDNDKGSVEKAGAQISKEANLFTADKVKVVGGKVKANIAWNYNASIGDYARYDLELIDAATPADTTAMGDLEHGWKNTFKWDGASPISFKHKVPLDEQVKTFETKTDVQNFYKDVDKQQWLQPNNTWMAAPGISGPPQFTPDHSVLSYNDVAYDLTRYTPKTLIYKPISSYYDPADLKFYDADDLHWQRQDTSVNLMPSTQGLGKILYTANNNLGAYNGKMIARFVDKAVPTKQNVLRLYTETTKGQKLPKELEGFYKTQPTSRDEAIKALMSDTKAGADVDNQTVTAISASITNYGHSITTTDGAGNPKKGFYFNPSDVAELKFEMLLGSAKSYETQGKEATATDPAMPGFKITTMLTQQQTDKYNVIVTQQDRGFSPIVDDGNWDASASVSSIGTEASLYNFADFIEAGKHYYYRRDYFNYDETGTKIDFAALKKTPEALEKYKLPPIMQGFYREDAKLDFSEYENGHDAYIISSLDATTNGAGDADGASGHKKLIFNGENGPLSVVSYKGNIYHNRSIQGMIVHTSWSPYIIAGTRMGLMEAPNKTKWIFQDEKTEFDIPDDFVPLKEGTFEKEVLANETSVEEMLDFVTTTPFKDIKHIQFTWNNEKLGAAIDADTTLLNKIKGWLTINGGEPFKGTLSTVVENFGWGSKFNIKGDDVAEKLFKTSKDEYDKGSIAKAIADRINKYIKLKEGEGE